MNILHSSRGGAVPLWDAQKGSCLFYPTLNILAPQLLTSHPTPDPRHSIPSHNGRLSTLALLYWFLSAAQSLSHSALLILVAPSRSVVTPWNSLSFFFFFFPAVDVFYLTGHVRWWGYIYPTPQQAYTVVSSKPQWTAIVFPFPLRWTPKPTTRLNSLTRDSALSFLFSIYIYKV